MLRARRFLAVVAAALASSGAAAEASCPGNPNALGVSRTIAVDPALVPRVGRHDYGRSLPLARGEVVLTFDDGPMSPYTQHVLRALADECVRAMFFVVGRRANAHPQLIRQMRAAGHTIGTHTQNHPLHAMAHGYAEWEINTGVASAGAALGDPAAVAPFFRFPGLFRTTHAERYLQSRNISAWSIDIDSLDWKRIGPQQMLHHTLAQLRSRGGGILLMHDIQPKTALMLPTLLAELKRRGFRIVHVVPAGTIRRPMPAPSVSIPGIDPSTGWPQAMARGHAPQPARPLARRPVRFEPLFEPRQWPRTMHDVPSAYRAR